MKILVVDDEQAVRESLRRSLSFNGYDIELAADGHEAVDLVHRESPDLIILDVNMPNMDGLEVCRVLRGEGWGRPILMLTARDGVSDRVAGLDAGADDYLPKPFALEELLARVRSLVRRAAADSAAGAKGNSVSKLVFEDLHLDADTREVSRGTRPISLTRTEFSLLQLLMENPRKVLSRNTILEEVWGYDFPTSGNALEVYIGYLRKKTEADNESRLIHTVRGVGYVLRESNA
ncbi:response regulator transcription factor [uncultured Corynebacterium sp.]|uniref:response regulator transcription factor n=1 Tax=uncultured Corynebacterium sp. TaxID=159447 RepID=UPI0025D5FC07|nr:response regulator transcription factor [uncultured Corynebacterium sp.]